jgi:methyltransferase-like protein
LIGAGIMGRIDQVFRKNENFVFRQIDDETILVPIKNNVGDMGAIYNLNEVGAYVWSHLDGRNTLLDVKNGVVEEFEVSPQDAEGDLMEFVGQLEEIEAILEMPKVIMEKNL